MTQEFNIMIVGVGGQGVMTLGRFFREYGMQNDFIQDILAAESKGVSQREGSVYSIVRYSLKSEPFHTHILTPYPALSKIDLMVALEPLEFVRNLHFLSPTSKIILNINPILPKNLVNKKHIYDEVVDLEQIQKIFSRDFPNIQLISKNYTTLALETTGKSISMNQLMLESISLLYPTIFNPEKIIPLLRNFFL